MAVSVGIDLGTTFSAVAFIDPKTKQPRIIPNREGNRITPSVIQFKNGHPVFGSEAESALNAGEEGCVATFKREMGNPAPYYTFDGVSYTAESLSALLLGHLKEDAEAGLGDTIKDAVITVPAYFYDLEREATERAAEAAGLKVKKIIDEPNAAAMAYGLNNWRENANILVYDLGGGTFDVTLTHMGQPGELWPIKTRGDHKLGGKDWDDRIESMLFDLFENETGLNIRSDGNLKLMLRGMTEGIKKQLSAMETVKAAATFPGYGSATVEISRSAFNENTADLLDRTGAFCQAVLAEAGVSIRDITDVLLVGGSTRMPQVSQYILKLFDKKPIAHVNPDEAVALGAAIQSSKENSSYATLSVQVIDGKKVTDHSATGLMTKSEVKPPSKLPGIDSVRIHEITAHAMGIIAISEDGSRYYNEIIIPANHPRPVRSAKKFRFYTSGNSDNKLEIYVLQGSSENPLDCQIPHKYVVTGIRHVKKGEEAGTLIWVRYSYDDNGIIRIQARQEQDKVDLRIDKDNVPADMSKYGKPVEKKQSGAGSSFLGLQFGRGVNQDVVHKYKPVTFSNVKWEKYDNISSHPSGAAFNEPKVHVEANEKAIEFHGYNVSQMDEGVYYTISADDDFEIECSINTSDIKPHPGGNVNITLGIITASLNQNGGDMILDGKKVATVGSKFKLKMSVTNSGHYEIYTNDILAGSKDKPGTDTIDVRFGLAHDSHCCELLSHAYISNIEMKQRENQDSDAENSDADTWDD
ncbi:MAG: Hsp70 family protein [Treponema sp.]|jgi:molecular chaperone DnaK|nr:Hsp70 family protein [Treponema sp.]